VKNSSTFHPKHLGKIMGVKVNTMPTVIIQTRNVGCTPFGHQEIPGEIQRVHISQIVNNKCILRGFYPMKRI
jgi:hypothetical protein